MRVPRFETVRAGYQTHMMWRSHNKESNLSGDEAKDKYLKFTADVLQSERESPSKFYAMCLMTTHAHAAAEIVCQRAFSKEMQRVHTRYGIWFNRRMERHGKVAYDRPKTVLIGDERAQMEVTFYIHANPVAAGMVNDAKDYFYSTHRLYAYGVRDKMSWHIEFPPWYLNLGRTMRMRQKRYRQLFDYYIKRKVPRIAFLTQFFWGPPDWEVEQTKQLRARQKFRRNKTKATGPPT